MKKDIEEKSKRVDDQSLQLYLQFNQQLDKYKEELAKEQALSTKNAETIEMLRFKLEKQVENNALLLQENKLKTKQAFELREDLDKFEVKMIKYQDKKRLLNKKIQEQLAIEQNQ
mmetsp:Transcript_19956/g.18958  ORF Transcript_19956/g.18958 Transcript_19956/m.18958 type:complete len:115 (-) Transcript_19956:156-500(-)